MSKSIWMLIVACLAIMGSGGCVSSDGLLAPGPKITLSSMFKKNAVLQRGKAVPVWGKGKQGRTIEVSFAGQFKTCVVDSSGNWIVALDPMETSSSPSDMKVDYLASENDPPSDESYAVTVRDILVGEVWFCSGQSNMELGMAAIDGSEAELDDTDYPEIRIYFIAKNASAFPIERISSAWFPSERDTIATMGWRGFSAVAFIFARKIHRELGVPVGIILSAYGGSNIHPWIPQEELAEAPSLARYHNEWSNANKTFAEAAKKDKTATHPFDGIFDYNRLKPVTLYNAMVSPVKPFALAGFLWYQGESDVGQGMVYAEKMKALIKGWRRVFNQGEIPFFYVELPPWNYGNPDSLPSMWEAQEACLSIPNTGMAVTIDVGDAKDIHPTRKKEVGERLALIALAKTYGKTGFEFSGPVYKGIAIDKGQAVISFEHAENGLIAKDGKPLNWFTIAGEDGVYVPATAVITGKTVRVRSEKVPDPVHVRYAWSTFATNPDPNLCNKEGLPARPFRSDR